MIKNLKLRLARTEDAAAIARLELRSARYEQRTYELPEVKELTEIWQERLTEKTFAAILALSGERLTGFAALELPYYVGHLQALYVDPTYFRRGIGRILTEAACAQARQHGAVQLRLEVEVRNIGAQIFYRSLNFVQTKVQSAPHLLNFIKEL